MNPRDFLTVADALILGDSEAEWRTALSRAYYATFHVARNLLRQCGFVIPQSEQAHAYLGLRLANCGHPDIVQGGKDLIDLRRQRNRANYDLDRTLEQKSAVRHVLLAADIISLLEQAATEPAIRTLITDSMKDYKRDVLKEVTWQP